MTAYSVHGVGLDLVADDADAAAALDSRLRHFRVPSTPSDAVRFLFSFGAHDQAAATGRDVYDLPAGRVVYDDAEDRLTLEYEDRARVTLEPGRGVGRAVADSPSAENVWLVTHPLFTIPLLELMKRRGRFNVHAGAVAVDGSGLLVAGGSGAGKSTLSIALARAGAAFLGDDMVFLDTGDGEVEVLAFPDEVDLTEQSAAMFPELAHLPPPEAVGPRRKHRLRLEDFSDADVVLRCRPSVLVFPRISGRDESRLTPLDQREALLELVPNVLLTEQASSQAHLDALARLVETSECYRLETGRDLDRAALDLLGLVGRAVPRP